MYGSLKEPWLTPCFWVKCETLKTHTAKSVSNILGLMSHKYWYLLHKVIILFQWANLLQVPTVTVVNNSRDLRVQWSIYMTRLPGAKIPQSELSSLKYWADNTCLYNLHSWTKAFVWAYQSGSSSFFMVSLFFCSFWSKSPHFGVTLIVHLLFSLT